MARLFEVLENPVEGWTIREITHIESVVDDEHPWAIKLIRDRDGKIIEHKGPDLYVVWARAVEAARSADMFAKEDEDEDDDDYVVVAGVRMRESELS